MPELKQLAQRLRKLRLELGMTQEEFAEKAGLSYKFYQQIEAGRKKQIWLETVERLADGFGLKSWQLLSPDVDDTSPIRAVAEPAAAYATHPPRRGRKTSGAKKK